jgi:hypothetical protein
MDAKTFDKRNLPSRHVTHGSYGRHRAPREFYTFSVTDGIAMGHNDVKASLVSRDVIADPIELSMRGHCYDAVAGAIWKYEQTVGSARKGAVTHRGGGAESACYADI